MKSLHLFRCVLKSRQVWNVADLAGKIAQCSCRIRKRKPCCNIGRQLVRLSKLTRSCEVYSCSRLEIRAATRGIFHARRLCLPNPTNCSHLNMS